MAIIAIELAIIFPSYANLKRAKLNDYENLARTAISAALIDQTESSLKSDIELHLQQLLNLDSKFTGIELVNRQGRVIASIGETVRKPIKQLSTNHSNLLDSKQRYEVFIPAAEFNAIVRMDTSGIDNDLTNFILRIAGLALTISLVVGFYRFHLSWF